jgi:Arc/MetJ family transcription regulator
MPPLIDDAVVVNVNTVFDVTVETDAVRLTLPVVLQIENVSPTFKPWLVVVVTVATLLEVPEPVAIEMDDVVLAEVQLSLMVIGWLTTRSCGVAVVTVAVVPETEIVEMFSLTSEMVGSEPKKGNEVESRGWKAKRRELREAINWSLAQRTMS